MTQLTLDIPRGLTGLPPTERNSLIQEGLYEAIRARIPRIHAEIRESQQHIRQYETKYNVFLQQFEAELLVNLDTPEAHADYNDWFFWSEVLSRSQRLLAELEKTLPG